MNTVYSYTTLNIVESCSEGDCSLTWELNSDDNNNPACYLNGTSYFIRLYESPQDLTIITFATNGSIRFDSNVEIDIEEEYLVFSGEQTENLDFPLYSDFNCELIGNAYSESGELIPSITFSSTIGLKEIMASLPCFAVIKVSYKSRYLKHSFVGNSVGTLLLIALADCEGDSTAKAVTTIDIKSSCADSECLPITVESDTSSDDGANYANENKALIRVYGAERNQITVGTTRGSIEFLGVKEETIEEDISGCNGDFSASEFVYRLISQETLSGNLNPFLVENGDLVMPINPEDGYVHGIPPGYGTVRIKYVSRWLEFLVTSAILGKGVFFVKNDENELCDIICIGYELGEGEGVKKYDITVIYKDFVTGAPIADAEVWVDDVSVGRTNAAGELLIEDVISGIKHRIRSEKPGFLNSDSDSLANDSFIIRES